MSVDIYNSFVPTIMPFLIRQFGLSLSQAGFYSSFLGLLSSFLQPLFGFLADKTSTRAFVVAGPMIIGIFVSLTGKITEVWQLLPLLIVASIGTASFHPQAAALSSKLAPSHAEQSPSIAKFVLCGTIGASLSSVLAYALIGEANIIGNLVFAMPIGLLGGTMVLLNVPRIKNLRTRKEFNAKIWRKKARSLSSLIGVVIVRSMVIVAFGIFIPELLFKEETNSLLLGAIGILVFHLANALGSLMGSYAANRIGTINVIFLSFAAGLPLILIFLETKSLILLFLAGLIVNMSQAINVNLAQKLIPENAATVSSLTMGFGWGIATLAMPAVGHFGDLWGLSKALELNALIFLVIGGVLAVSLKYNRQIKEHINEKVVIHKP